MSGSLIQIGTFGKQDVETVLNPSLTFWKSVYKRHTPFALEIKAVETTSSADWGRRFSSTVDKIGDLLAKAYIYVELGNLNGGAGGAYFCDDVGRAMFEELVLEIGAVQFDKIYPDHVHAREEVSQLAETQLGKLTGKSSSVAELILWARNTQYLYIPIDIWFCDDYGAALPLVALHLSDVKFTAKLRQKSEVIIGNPNPYVIQATDAVISDLHLLFETVILDDPERDWFANTPLKYIITQHQYLGAQTLRAGATNATIDVVFNHPIKEYTFMFRSAANTAANNWFNYSGGETGNLLGEAFKTMQLTFNGQQRIMPMGPLYYRVLQNKNHHARIPRKNIYTYSFALYPNDPNPTGSYNASRVDTTRMLFTFTALGQDHDFLLYCMNINTCTVSKGVCLLAFAS